MEWEAKLKEHQTEQAKLWEEYKGVVSKEVKDGLEGANGQTKETLTKMETKFTEIEKGMKEATDALEKKAEDTKKMETKLAEMEAKLNRPMTGLATKVLDKKDFFCKFLYDEATAEKAEEKAEVFWDSFQRPHMLTPEQKAMTINDPETGGYLAPPEFVNEIIKEIREITPAMQIATVRTTTRNSMTFPIKTGTTTAKRRGESETKVESDPVKYGAEQITLPEMYAFIDVTQMDLEDSGFNLEAEIREELIDSFAAKLGAEFINGSGPLQLEGLQTNADIGETSSGSNSVLQPNQLITFIESALKQQFKVRASLMFNQSTLAAIRILQVPTVGGYVWAPGFEKTPPTIMGKSYIISEDMPDIAQNAYPIMYGDFKKGYKVGLRVRLGINRIVDSALDATGEVRFSGRQRVGGKVVQAVAIKKHKISA